MTRWRTIAANPPLMFTPSMGTGASASVLNDSRCPTTVAPMILPLATVECELSTKAPPRSANCRGHGTEGVGSSMHEQSIPTRHDARPATRIKLAIALCLRRLAARLELGATVDTLPPLDREEQA